MAHLGIVPPYDDVTVQQTEQEEKSPALLSSIPRSISGERAIRLPLRDEDKNSSRIASYFACLHGGTHTRACIREATRDTIEARAEGPLSLSYAGDSRNAFSGTEFTQELSRFCLYYVFCD